MLKLFSSLLLIILFCVGCVNTRDYIGLEPLDPVPGVLFGTPGGEDEIPVIKSLLPTLKWKDPGPGNYEYDLAIWVMPDTNEVRLTGINYSDPDYYVEGIKNNKYTLEKPLYPDTVYMWSVRHRIDKEVGKWSVYKETNIRFGGGTYKLWNSNFSFKTPKK